MTKAGLILILLALFGGSVLQAQIKVLPKEKLDSVANPPLAPDADLLKFDRLRIDAGEIDEDAGHVIYTYRFVNTGNAPVRISRLVSTCSCAVATVSDRIVAPGKEGEISLRYDPEGHPGRFERRVFVYTDSNVQPSAVLRLAVRVISGKGMANGFPVQMGSIRTQLDMVSFKKGKADAARVRFINLSGRSLRLECERMMLAGCLDFAVEPNIIEAGQEGVMTISYDPKGSHPASGKAMVMLKGLGVPPSQSSIKVILK